MTQDRPSFRDLTTAQMHALLARNHVGRIAFGFRNRVDIQPIHYVFADGVVYLRTEPGSKLRTLAHAPWVAFEVDEVDGPFDWRSVVARGTVYVRSNAGSVHARAAYRRALARLREVNPRVLKSGDPAPQRRVVLVLDLDEITGREARTSTTPRKSRRPRTAKTTRAPKRRAPSARSARRRGARSTSR